MGVSTSPPSRLQAPTPRASYQGPDAIGRAVVIALTSALFAVTTVALLRGHSIVAVLLATVTTASIAAIAQPRVFRLVAMTALLAVPLVQAIPVFRAQDFNYFLYAGALALVLVGLGMLQPTPLPGTWGLAYLGYVLFAASLVAVGTEGLDGVRLLPSLMASFGIYVLVFRSNAVDRRILLGGMLAFGAFQSLVSVSQAVWAWPVFTEVLPELHTGNRNYFAYVIPGLSPTTVLGSGTFYHFNLLGSILAMLAPVAFALWLQRMRSVWRLTLFVTLTAGTLATFSRGGLIGLGLGVGILLLGEYRRGRLRASAALVSAIAVVALLGANIVGRYVESTANASVRASTWRYAMDEALDVPSNLLFGYGFGHFHSVVLGPGYEGLPVRSYLLASLHSGTLQVLLEFGVVGAILFALWLMSAFRSGVARPDSFLVRGLVAGAASFTFYQVVENILFAYPGTLFVALVACLEAECRDTSSRFSPKGASGEPDRD